MTAEYSSWEVYNQAGCTAPSTIYSILFTFQISTAERLRVDLRGTILLSMTCKPNPYYTTLSVSPLATIIANHHVLLFLRPAAYACFHGAKLFEKEDAMPDGVHRPVPEVYPAYCYSRSPTFHKWVKLTAADVHALRQERGFEGECIRDDEAQKHLQPSP